jgi:hypothetical protein
VERSGEKIGKGGVLQCVCVTCCFLRVAVILYHG